MLATTCEICGTVELQDKQGKTYCVACEEIDCEENSKDNPAVNPRAARNQIAEGQLEDLESQIITDRNQVCLYIILKILLRKTKASFSSYGTLIWNARYCPTNNTTQVNPYKSRGSGYPVDPSE